jgi:DNA-binding transcriptional regulator GbsR (MarR family)
LNELTFGVRLAICGQAEEPMDRPIAQFIERMGVALESDGMPRIAGRILGLLLVSEDALSLDELASELGVSKASISTNARLLEQRGVLERISRPADRRDYYRVPPDLFTHTMAQRLARWERFHTAIAAARTNLPIRSREVLERLREFEEAYAYMARTIREALAHWETSREERSARTAVLR